MGDGDSDTVQPALLNAFLLTTRDALMVLEAARRGICPVVTRRLHDSEKAALVGSGTVFAFDENATGIKRWTDGALWSPSRIIGNYLVYRELEKKTPNDNDKSGARPSTSHREQSSSPRQPLNDPFGAIPLDPSLPSTSAAAEQPFAASPSGSTGLQRDLERALVGSLTTSYRFKKDGLVKKTISNGSLHIICYYTIDDVIAGRLRTPSSLNELASLEISPGLLNPKNFRVPPMLEYDIAGNPRYAGEETDTTTGPSVLAPLLSTSRSAPIPIPPSSYEPYRRQSLGVVVSPGAMSPVARQMSVSLPYAESPTGSYSSRMDVPRPASAYPEGSPFLQPQPWNDRQPISAGFQTQSPVEAPYGSSPAHPHSLTSTLGLPSLQNYAHTHQQRPATAGPLAEPSAIHGLAYPSSRRASDASYSTVAYSSGPLTFPHQPTLERQRSETVPAYPGHGDLGQTYQPMSVSTPSYMSYPTTAGFDASGKYLSKRPFGQLYYPGRPTYSADVHFQHTEVPAAHPEEPSSAGLPGYADASGYYPNARVHIDERPREPPGVYEYDQRVIHDSSHWHGAPRHLP